MLTAALNFFSSKLFFYLLIGLTISFVIYLYHFKPIKDLEKEVKSKMEVIQVKESEIINLKIDIENYKVLLLRCQDEVEVQKTNTEICRYEIEAYEDNETNLDSKIKESTNAGYVTF